MSRNRRQKRNRRQSRKVDPTPVVPVEPTTELVFEDHFDDDALTDDWVTAYPWGRDRRSVGELQWYGEDAFVQRDSILSIVAREGSIGDWRYTSGIITTHGSFSTVYGRFEIRCKAPRGKGLWPAFWLLPVDTSWPPELDVIEIIGSAPNEANMTAHLSPGYSHGGVYLGPDFAGDFHRFALSWQPDRLVWSVDGIERHRYEGPTPRVPMYLLANLAVGGEWPGAPDHRTVFPASFDIDYIRAWRA